MRSHLLVTATGEDRPGIVASLAEAIVENGGNLEESRMALLGGEFAAIILVTVPADRLSPLRAALNGLNSEKLSIAVRETGAVDASRFQGYVPCELKVSGADHEGIVHRVASFLRDRMVNIQSMESDVVSAPVTGTPLFSMRATIQVPPRLTVAELRRHLNTIGEAESVEIELSMPDLVAKSR